MSRALAAVLLAASLTAAAAAAEEPAPARHREGASLVLAIAGGVSLGAYEAGSLYYGLAVTRANPGFAKVRGITGASAGSVNGLISVIGACGAETPRPSDSMLWQSWIPLGLGELAAGGASPLAAFSPRALRRAADRIEAAFVQGLEVGCDVVLGVTVTRVTPREVKAAGIALPRIEEKFVVRIRGRGAGVAPSIRNYVDPEFPVGQLLLPEQFDGEVPFAALRELITASSAFPVAFAPQRVHHCLFVPGEGRRPRCLPGEARSDLFVDGGILDNAPLRLAARVAGAGLLPEGGPRRWAAHPYYGQFDLPEDALFVYVSPEIPAWPGERPVEDDGPPASVTPLVAKLADGFVSTARAKELLTLLEEHPEIGARTLAPRRHFPAASRPLQAFLGFVETQFRVFDFYLGMYDSRRMFEDQVLVPERAAGRRDALVWPDQPFEGEAGHESRVIGGWRPLACLHAVVERDIDLMPACDDPSLEDFRVLLQVSLERLYSDCARRTPVDAATTRHDHCLAAMGGAPPPQVRGVEWPEGLEWREQPGEGEAGHVMRLLSAHRFHFRDLGLRREDAGEAMREFRERAGAVMSALGDQQPVSERLTFSLATSLALNAFAYVPPHRAAWVMLGRDLEVGLAQKVPSRRLDVRLQAVGTVNRVSDLLSSDETRLSMNALGGVELLPGFLSDARTQASLALRAGWLFATEDDFGSRPCKDPGRIGACSGPMLQAALAFSFLDRARAQLGWEVHLATERRPEENWALTPGLGVQLAF